MDWTKFRWNFLKGLHNAPSQAAAIFLERYLSAGGAWTPLQQRNLWELFTRPEVDATAMLLLLAHLDPVGTKSVLGWLRQQEAESVKAENKPKIDHAFHGEFLTFLWKKSAEPLSGLLEQLQSGESATRERAFLELQDYGRGAYRALPALRKALGYEAPQRLQAALLIQVDDIDHPEAMEFLCSVARQEHPASVLQVLARLLSERQHIDAPALLDEMLGRVRLGSSEYMEICACLGHMGAASRSSGRKLQGLLEHELPRMWPVACKALYQVEPSLLGHEEFLRMLRRLHHPLHAHRSQAVRALSWWRHLDAEDCGLLLGEIKSLSDPRELCMVLLSLASSPCEKVLDFLWHLVYHHDKASETAFQALLRYAEHSPEQLGALLTWAVQKKEEASLFSVIEQIGKVGYQPLRERLEAMAPSISQGSTLASVLRWSLARLQSPLALEFLRDLFRGDRPLGKLRVGPYNGFSVMRVLGAEAVEWMGVLRDFLKDLPDHALVLDVQRTILHLSPEERVAPKDFIFLSLSSCEYLWMYRHPFGMRRYLGEFSLLLDRFSLDERAFQSMSEQSWRVLLCSLQRRLLFLPGWSEIESERAEVSRGLGIHLARLQDTELSGFAMELEGALYT